MPLNLNLPPVRAKGDPGDYSDANLWRAAFLQMQSFCNQLETDVATALARPDIKVAASEPAHDGSQKEDDLWVVE